MSLFIAIITLFSALYDEVYEKGPGVNSFLKKAFKHKEWIYRQKHLFPVTERGKVQDEAQKKASEKISRIWPMQNYNAGNVTTFVIEHVEVLTWDLMKKRYYETVDFQEQDFSAII